MAFELFKSQAVSEDADALGDVSVKPSTFHNLQANTMSNSLGSKGAVDVMQIAALLVVVC